MSTGDIATIVGTAMSVLVLIATIARFAGRVEQKVDQQGEDLRAHTVEEERITTQILDGQAELRIEHSHTREQLSYLLGHLGIRAGDTR